MGENYGRKMMQGVIKAKGINIGETKISTILGENNSESQTKRQSVAGRSLNPKFYNAKYFVDKIHYNQNEKMGMFGVAHVYTRDGFSVKLVGYATMAKRSILANDYIFHFQKQYISDFSNIFKFPIVFSEIAFGAT